MNIRKFIALTLCAAVLPCCIAGCSQDRIDQNSGSEVSDMNSENTSSSGTSDVGTVEKEIPIAEVNPAYKSVTVDGNTVNTDAGTVYRGLVAVTGNNSSRLLMDYKTQNPDAYWEIMNLLFKPDYGAGLTHIKIEFGSDVNSSSGTEPSIMRSANETADVTRGAGFMFAADALTINPDITVDLLRWGEPKWVTDAFSESAEKGHEARYKWYKAAIDGAYDTYGMKFTHISADMNEAASVDTEWIIYLADKPENETDERYDYGAIKIVASDELGSWNIAKLAVTSIGSGLYNNVFDNLKVSGEGEHHTVTRVDDHDPRVTYTGDWDRTVPDGYVHFNRTRSNGTENGGDTAFEMEFEGDQIALVGETDAAKFDVYIDGELFESAETAGCTARQCWYSTDVPAGKHTLKVVVTEGTLSVDVIEY